MTHEEIQKAFEGRWRFKGEYIESGIIPFDSKEGVAAAIKSLCLNFFEAGIAIGENSPQPKESCVATNEDVCDTTFTFKQFWDAYDLKIGKEKCMKKWAKMSVKDREACIAAIPFYVASTPDKQFRKRPLTYLNGKCWNDEIIYRNNGTNKPTIEQQRIDKLADVLAG